MMVDYEQYAKMFACLREYIENEPLLVGFGGAAEQLYDQARGLAEGRTEVPDLDVSSPCAIPNRRLAEKIMKIVSRLPAVDFREENPVEQLLVARLLGNLVRGVTGAVFSSFPDVIPRS